eukprot:4794470-Alexandrium_andersonii.AAC.1
MLLRCCCRGASEGWPFTRPTISDIKCVAVHVFIRPLVPRQYLADTSPVPRQYLAGTSPVPR